MVFMLTYKYPASSSAFIAGHSVQMIPSPQVRMVHPALNYLLDPVQVGVLASFKEIIMISTLKKTKHNIDPALHNTISRNKILK